MLPHLFQGQYIDTKRANGVSFINDHIRSAPAREHVTSHMHCIDGEIYAWRMYSSFCVWTFMLKQVTFSTSNHTELDSLS